VLHLVAIKCGIKLALVMHKTPKIYFFLFLGIKESIIFIWILIDIFILTKHFSNAGFPCPIMQSPSDHFLRAINTDFDRIIAMCKNWQVLE
jgi:hypothetical protein